MSIIDTERLKERTKEVAIKIGTDLKESNKTSKIVIIVLAVLFICTAVMAYNLYTTNAEINALKTENVMIKNRLKDIDSEISKNQFEYLDIVNKVNNIDKDLKDKLDKAKEVIIHEVQTSNDIINVLNDLSSNSTDQ